MNEDRFIAYRIAMFRFCPHLAVSLSLSALFSVTLPAAMADESNAGPLDRPLALPGEQAVVVGRLL